MTTRYRAPAMGLHWAMAVLILAAFALGLTMVDMKFSPLKLKLYSWHKWAGITIFALALLRVAWRVHSPPPPPLPGQPRWQLGLAGVTHALFYLLLLVVPLSGWLFSSAAGFKTVYLGLLPIPDLLPRSPDWKDSLKLVHLGLTGLLGGLVLVHVAAVLKHALIERDGTLARMLPWGDPTRAPATERKDR